MNQPSEVIREGLRCSRSATNATEPSKGHPRSFEAPTAESSTISSLRHSPARDRVKSRGRKRLAAEERKTGADEAYSVSDLAERDLDESGISLRRGRNHFDYRAFPFSRDLHRQEPRGTKSHRVFHSFPVGNYIIYYSDTELYIVISRVLHG